MTKQYTKMQFKRLNAPDTYPVALWNVHWPSRGWIAYRRWHLCYVKEVVDNSVDEFIMRQVLKLLCKSTRHEVASLCVILEGVSSWQSG